MRSGSECALRGPGAFATEVTATPPFQQVHHIHDEMPFDQASPLDLTYGTGYHGLIRRGQLAPAEAALVLGATGECGSAAVTDRQVRRVIQGFG